jgi:hypothetical protein
LHIGVKLPAGLGIATPVGKGRDLQHPHALIQRDGQDIAQLDTMAGRVLTVAVDANPTAFDQRRGAGPRFDDPRVPQPFIEALTFHAFSPILATAR